MKTQFRRLLSTLLGFYFLVTISSNEVEHDNSDKLKSDIHSNQYTTPTSTVGNNEMRNENKEIRNENSNTESNNLKSDNDNNLNSDNNNNLMTHVSTTLSDENFSSHTTIESLVHQTISEEIIISSTTKEESETISISPTDIVSDGSLIDQIPITDGPTVEVPVSSIDENVTNTNDSQELVTATTTDEQAMGSNDSTGEIIEEGQKVEEDAVDDIETFEEFKSRQNTPVNNQGNILIHKGGNNNFASHECGAKIVATNPEAKSPGAILTDNDDIYMLNPCSAEIWFVIELCELVSVSKFEIGCFELFSSIPESFAVYTSDSFPTSNWDSLGSFFMRNERGVQEFLLADPVYAKYVKIVMLKHFGSEHYCPVSTVRVYGATLMEEYEYSEYQREKSSSNDVANQEEQITIKGDAANEELNTAQSNGNPIFAATDAIFNAIGKAVNGLIEKVKETDPAKEEDSHESFPPLQDNGSDSSTSENTGSTSQSLELDTMSTPSCSLPNTPPLINLSLSTDIHTPLGPTSIEDFFSHSHSIEFDSQINTKPDITTFTGSLSPTPSDKVINIEKDQETVEIIQPTQPNIYNAPSITQGNNDTEPLTNSTNAQTNITNSSSTVTVPSQTNNISNNVSTNNSNINSTNSNSTVGDESGTNNGSPREKSVFVRLSNRINNLELNMSLFGSYLEQISTSLKRSKNRTDDMQKCLERRMSSLNSTIHSFELQTQLNDSLLIHLSDSLDNLTLLVTTYYGEKYVLLELVLLITLTLVVSQCLLLVCCCILWTNHQANHSKLHRSLEAMETQLSSIQEQLKKSTTVVQTVERDQKCNGHHYSDSLKVPTTLAGSDRILSHSLSIDASGHTESQWQKVECSKRKRKSFPSSRKDPNKLSHSFNGKSEQENIPF